MAADVGGQGRQATRHGHARRSNPRIDMTPMVDLGFLLLTFFVLTTRMSSPFALELLVPAQEDPQAPQPALSEEKVLTVVVTGQDKIYWYPGRDVENLSRTTLKAPKSFRNALAERKAYLEASRTRLRITEADPLVVLIKMTDDANYANLVSMMDEMLIAKQRRYMLLDASQSELQAVERYESSRNEASSVRAALNRAG